jgi:phosphatidylglycerophosphatase C
VVCCAAPKIAFGFYFLDNQVFIFVFFWKMVKRKTEAELATLGARFCLERLPQFLRPTLLARLRQGHQSGARVVIVSASPDVWLRPFCAAEGFDLICTMLAFDAVGRFSGQLATPNCNGAEKARRIRAAYDLAAFARIVAFGNSAGDAAMLALAHEAHLLR